MDGNFVFDPNAKGVEGRVYIATQGTIPNVPMRLDCRRIGDTLDSEFAKVYLDLPNAVHYDGQELSGNDILVFEGGGDTSEILEFKPLVDLSISLGVGSLFDVRSGQDISGTPIVHFDHQDDAFDATLASMRRFMRCVNA